MSANSHVMERTMQPPEPEGGAGAGDPLADGGGGPAATPRPPQSRMSGWLGHQLGRLLAISASLVSTYVITGGLGLLFWAIAARRLSIAEVGVAGAAIALMSLLGGLGSLGLGALLIQKIPQTPQPHRRVLVRSSLALAAATSFVLTLLVATGVAHLSDAPALRSLTDSPLKIGMLAAGTALATVGMILDQAVLVLGVGTLQMKRNTVASVAKIVALFAMPSALGGMAVFAAWTIGIALSLLVIVHGTRGGRALEEPTNKLVDLAVIRQHARAVAGNYALSTMLIIPLQMLPIICSVVLSQRDNGLFTATLRISEICFVLPYSLSIGLFAASAGSPRSVLRQMRVTLPMALAICGAAAIVAFFGAPLLLSLFGSAYSAEAATILRLVVLASIGFAVKDHFVAFKRVQERTGSAAVFFFVFTLIELVAATAGAKVAGLAGLVSFWLAVVAVQAVIMLTLLFREDRRSRGTSDDAPAADDVPAAAVDDVPPLATAAAADDVPPLPTAGAAAVPAAAADARLSAASDAAPVAPGDAKRVSAKAAARHAAADEDNVISCFINRQGLGFPLLVIAVGLAIFTVGIDQARAMHTGTGMALYLAGLALLIVPAVGAALLPGLTDPFRRWVPIAMLVALQLTRFIQFPHHFTDHDELAHAANLEHLMTTGELYGANPILPVTASYPGLATAAGAVAQLTGLSEHTSGMVVTFIARVIFAAAIYGVAATAARSARVGGVAVVIYACAPQTLLFNSQYAYQTLALPLALFAVYLVARRHADGVGGLVAPMLTVGAVALTHHLTSIALLGIFGLWWLLTLVRRRRTDRWGRRVGELSLMVVATAAAIVGVALMPGNVMTTYLGSAFQNAVASGMAALSAGETKTLFVNPAGLTSSLAEKLAMAGSIALTGLGLLFGWWHARTWLRRRNAALGLLLIALSAVFVLEPLGHVVQSTAEIADRSTSYAFLGIGFVLGLWAWSRRMTVRRFVVLGTAAVVMFAGGVMLGAGPMVMQVPGGYFVGADHRTVDRDNIAASEWMRTEMPTGSRVFADRVGMLLAAGVGAEPLTQIGTGVDASDLLLAPGVTPQDYALIKNLKVEYLMVDERDSTGLPNLGIYVTGGEYGLADRRTPVPLSTLRKFAGVPGAQQIYTNGSMKIYTLKGVNGG